MPLDIALQHHAIARRQLATALKEFAAAERVDVACHAPAGAAPVGVRVDALRRALDEAEAELARAPARTVWAFLIKVEALVSETMSPDTVAAIRRDVNGLLDSQSNWAA